MKSFKEYLVEVEHRLNQVDENSNLPTAVDRTSPIHGGSNFADSERLQRRPKQKNETVPNHGGQFSPIGGTEYSRRTSGSDRFGRNTKAGRN